MNFLVYFVIPNADGISNGDLLFDDCLFKNEILEKPTIVVDGEVCRCLLDFEVASVNKEDINKTVDKERPLLNNYLRKKYKLTFDEYKSGEIPTGNSEGLERRDSTDINSDLWSRFAVEKLRIGSRVDYFLDYCNMMLSAKDVQVFVAVEKCFEWEDTMFPSILWNNLHVTFDFFTHRLDVINQCFLHADPSNTHNYCDKFDTMNEMSKWVLEFGKCNNTRKRFGDCDHVPRRNRTCPIDTPEHVLADCFERVVSKKIRREIRERNEENKENIQPT